MFVGILIDTAMVGVVSLAIWGNWMKACCDNIKIVVGKIKYTARYKCKYFRTIYCGRYNISSGLCGSRSLGQDGYIETDRTRQFIFGV